MKSVRRRYIPVTDKGKEFGDFIVPSDNPKIIELLASNDYLSPDPSGAVMLQESIVRLFEEGFNLDIRTCSEREWAERITIKGGTLKQWQAVTKETKTKEMGSRKAAAIFIGLSIVLLTGIGLLPKSAQVFVPASASIERSTIQQHQDQQTLAVKK